MPINVDAVPLIEVRDLGAEELVWTTLMFDLIRERFWERDTRLPELSYTGEMIVEPEALVSSTGALVKDGFYTPLELPALRREDVTAEATREQWEREPTGFNRWMVERYGDRVPDAFLNPVGAEAQRQLAAHASAEIAAAEKRRGGGFFGANGSPAPGANLALSSPGGLAFETMSPVTFGTKAQLERDRVWTARMNQMKVIQRLADAEFEHEREAMVAWFRQRVAKNLPLLLEACARGELVLPDWHAAGMTGVGRDDDVSRIAPKNVLQQGVGTDWGQAFPHTYGMVPEVRFGSWSKRRSRFYCVERESVLATVFTRVRPTCPEALALLAGVTVPELPWALQHWYSQAPYDGNCILARLDPEDWELTNPWMPEARGLRWEVGLFHSKLALHARRKQLGLPRKDYVSPPEEK